MSGEDLRRQSLNPGWTNREVLFHTTLAFLLLPPLFGVMRGFGRVPTRYSKAFATTLNFATPGFNVVNGAGARIGGRLISPRRLTRLYDGAHRRILRRLNRLNDADLRSGMYFPARWDTLFSEYMTLELLLAYPVAHYRFHAGQLAYA